MAIFSSITLLPWALSVFVSNQMKQVMYQPLTREEQVEAMELEKKAMEERKRLKEAGLIGSTMDALGGAASLLGSGVGLVVGSGLGAGVGLVGSGIGAVGTGLGKAGKFMGRTVTANLSSMASSRRTAECRWTTPRRM